MSVLNEGNNLAGVLIDIESEVSRDYDPSLWGTTESVVVIGTAFQGPVGVPTQIYNVDMARYFFGATYDSATHRSASLVSGIQACFERGCRTIYGMRVGGKDIYKDFRLCEASEKYRLRISGQTPTNITKQCYLRINVASGFEQITLYKPATKATIAERKQALVEDMNSVLVSHINLNADIGLTRNDKLVDLVTHFNRNEHNNVFVMSIVDADGNDVTNAPEAQDLRIGSLFSGVYFVGRDKNSAAAPAYSVVTARAIISESDPKPYSSYKEKFYRVVEFNSDVSSEYPITARRYDELKNLLQGASVAAGSDYKFLETPGVADRVWVPDAVDYEEAGLTGFELYKRLGSGFAVTAQAIERKGKDSKGRERRPRIIETPADDANHIVGINDGIYALLENTECQWRVLVAANADDKADGKLPKAEAFKIASPNQVKLFGNPVSGNGALITATPKVDETDLTAPKEYEFHFVKVDEEETEYDNIGDIYTDHVAKIIGRVDGGVAELKAMLKNDKYPNGTMFLVFEPDNAAEGHLYRILDGKAGLLNISRLENELLSVNRELYVGQIAGDNLVFVPADVVVNTDAPTTYLSKEYVLVDNGTSLFVAAVGESKVNPGKCKLRPLGTLETMLGDNDNKTLIYVENSYGQKNLVNITTGAADFIPLEEFMELMQEDTSLNKLFSFELTEEGADLRSEYPEDIETSYVTTTGGNPYFEQALPDGTVAPGETYVLAEEKSIGYDYSKYIPFRTSDNFVRQLAQHCAKTSLGTSMTHGVIGYSPLRNYSLKGIAERVNELLSADYSLYAKKWNGREMLGLDGNPYEVGGNVTVTAFQYPITSSNDGVVTTVNGAAGYAGMVSVLPVDQSTTLQPTGLPTVDFIFSNNQLKQLIGKGYVTTKMSSTKGICIADGVTMAPASEFRNRLSIVRTMNACGDSIRQAAEPYIGKKNNLQNRSALKTAVDGALNSLKDTLIWDYKFEIDNLSTYTSDAEINITYEIFPMNEIRSVTNSITISHQSTGGNNA